MHQLLKLICVLFLFFNMPIDGLSQTIHDSVRYDYPNQNNSSKICFDGKKFILTKKEWKERLSSEAFEVLREGGTERAFHNKYFDWKEKGIYACAGCNLPLFSSDAKYDSQSGWPSFWRPICPENVTYTDTFWSFFTKTKEVKCSRCEGHLGDVFDDGPPPTGKRYCINSAALNFIAR
jgi:peptide-methionine (R)-S-oxide reductase